MSKKIFFLILLGILVLAGSFSGLVLAQSTGLHGYDTSGAVTSQGDINITDLVENIEKVTGLIFGAVAVICFVLSGILFLTAQGAPEKVTTARHAFIWGVAGVVVGLIAFSIISIVADFLQGSSNSSTPTTPAATYRTPAVGFPLS